MLASAWACGFFAGLALAIALFRPTLEPWQRCRYCRNAHDKQLHDDLLKDYGDD